MDTTIPTLKDVARYAGVSIATVSYVLNGRRQANKTISEATRQKVLQAVSELGYTPNHVARHLRRQRTERICVVLPRLGVPYYEAFCQDIEAVAQRYNYTVILSLTGSREKELKVLKALQHRLADGVIALHGDWEGEELTQLSAMGIAVVVLDNYLQAKNVDVVRTTEEDTFYEAVSYLATKGYQKIVCFLGSDTRGTRYAAYQRALRDHGLPLDERFVVEGCGDRQIAYQETLKLLKLKERPDAIFAGSDVAAISAIWAVRDGGLRIPDDIAIIGAGNIAEGEITVPPLTTVGPASLDFSDVAEFLFDRLRNPDQQERVLLRQWKLILRGSA
jgi:DNA-binding LacI/PurR family transcriptional regulator